MAVKSWKESQVSEWNVNTFHQYLSEKHKELFGCDYAPYRGWTAEKGLLGSIVGTARKEGKHDKEAVKEFIDVCLKEYQPNRNYPGISFGFMWTYKTNVWQRVLAERNRKQQAQTVTMSDDQVDDIIDMI